MIVDGQLYGGAAQGIGTALFEEMRYDSQGQPIASLRWSMITDPEGHVADAIEL